MNKLVTSLLLLMILSASCQQASQTSCHSETATASFASLGSDATFRNEHDTPEAISYAEKGKSISFPTPDGKNGSAYFIPAPEKSDKYIFVFHEWWGINDFVKRQSDLYAETLKNVNVMAIDLYEGKVTTDREEAAKIMQSIDETRAKNIIKGALTYVGKNAEIATVGWCFGGGWSLQGALLAGKQTKGCVMYYGMPEEDVNKLKTLNSDVVFIFAQQDQWINDKVKEDFITHMKEAGKTLTVKEYDADHAFANPSNPKYAKDAAADAEKITLDYFKSRMN
jgi:carboxymethylenebutenolidase